MIILRLKLGTSFTSQILIRCVLTLDSVGVFSFEDVFKIIVYFFLYDFVLHVLLVKFNSNTWEVLTIVAVKIYQIENQKHKSSISILQFMKLANVSVLNKF